MHSNIWKLYMIKASKFFLIYIPFIVPFYQSNGLNLTAIMSLRSISAATLAVSTVPTGYLADRFGRKTLILCGTVLTTTGFIVYSLAGSFWGFVLAEIIIALGLSSIDGADSALLYDTVTTHKKTAANYTQIEGKTLAIGNLAEATAGFIGAAIVLVAGLRATFYIQVLIALLAIPAAWGLHEIRITKTGQSDQVRFKDGFRTIWQSPRLMVALFSSALITLAILQTTWLVQPLFEALQLPVGLFGLVWGSLQIMIAIAAWQAYKLEKRYPKELMVIGMLASMIIGVGLMSTLQWLWVIPAMVLVYGARGLSGPLMRQHVNSEAPPRLRATMLSYRSMFPRLMFMISGPLLGYLADQHGLVMTFQVFAGVLLVAAVSVIILNRAKHIHLASSSAPFVHNATHQPD